MFGRFVAERSELLPDDEALLAAQWELVERSLFEIEDVGADRLGLRDVRTGDIIEVTNTTPDSRTRPGRHLLGRPLPIADTWRAYSGFVSVPGPLVDDVLAALDAEDAFELAELIGATFRLPRMQNTDGHPLGFHELTWRLPHPAAARLALDDSELHDDGTGGYSILRDSTNQRDTIIVTFTLDGDELRASANSDQRADEAIARSAASFLMPS